MRFLLIMGVIFGLYYFLFSAPSPEVIMSKTEYNLKDREIIFDGKTHFAEWGPVVTKSGYLRYFGKATHDETPYLTHDTVLTTGDFSDSEKVYVSPIRSGNMYWRSKHKNLKGSLVVLHLFPLTAEIAKELSSLEEGDNVSFTVRVEEDSTVEDDNGLLIGLRHDNHEFVLVEEVKKNS